MKKLLKWTGFVLAGLVGIALLAVAYLYFASERELRREYTGVDKASLTIPTDAAGIAEGQRIARLAGCVQCHGENLTGTVVDDIPKVLRLVAPNISTVLPNYSDTQIATLVRKGVKPDGRTAVFMPSEMFRHLSDEDLARIIAWLRSVPATTDGVQGKTELRPLIRLILAKGDFTLAARAIESLPPAENRFEADDPLNRGRYLAKSFCTECHGQEMEGFAPLNAPPLVVVKGYSPEQFSRLMHEGIGLGERQFRIMTPVAQARFAHFTAEEVSAIYTFLQSATEVEPAL
jgi:cytochrome c553